MGPKKTLMILIYLTFTAFFTLSPIASAGLSPAKWIGISLLLPGQTSVGFAETKIRAKALEAMAEVDRREYLEDHEISVVTGPGGRLHLVDGHHLSFALLDLESRNIMEAKAPAVMLADFSALPEGEFWRSMEARQWVYLRDSDGRNIQPSDLPKTLKKMTDDRLRSLAWLLREEDCFDEISLPFQEFTWGNYLRKSVSMPDNRPASLRAGLLAAKELAHRAAAKNLPGFKLSHKQTPHGEISKKNSQRIQSLELKTLQ